MPRRHIATLVVFAFFALTNCGGDSKEASNTDVGEAQDAVDTLPTDADALDTGPAVPLIVKWEELIPDSPNKLFAATPIPGQTGHYVLVGEASTVLLYDGQSFKDISPDNIGTVNLTAVWAEGPKAVVVAGEGSSLITWDGSSWQVAGSVPPSPVINFRALHGRVGGDVWAVGDDGQAWRRQDAVWVSQSVTATSGADLAEQVNFVGVQVTDKAGIWLVADAALSGVGGVVLRGSGDGQWVGHGTARAAQQLWVDPLSSAEQPNAYVVGGTTDAFAAKWSSGKFIDAGDVKWSFGFRSVSGTGPDNVWLGGLKGQVRRSLADQWEVVMVAPPLGTVGGFPQPSAEILSIALHDNDELILVTGYKLYRYGKQP